MAIDWSKYGVESNKGNSKIDWGKYTEPEQPRPTMKERVDSGLVPPMDIRRSPLMQEAAKVEVSKPTSTALNRPGRDKPVIGPVLRTLDAIADSAPIRAVAEYTQPDAPLIRNGEILQGTSARKDFLERTGSAPATGVSKIFGQISAPFFVPGAGLGTGSQLYQGAGQTLTKYAPNLGQSLGGRVAREAIREGAIGAPLAAGIELSQGSSNLSDAALQGAIGGAAGAALGAAAPLVGRGINRISDRIASSRAGRVADNIPMGQSDVPAGQIASDAIQPPRRTETPNIMRGTDSPEQISIDLDVRPNERGLVTTLRESDRITPPVREGLEVSPTRTYEPLSNQTTVNRANTRIGQGLDDAESFVLGGARRLNAEQVATGFRLIDEFQRAGNVSRAVNMAERLAERLTEAGQAVQAASIWNRLTPEGALLSAQRKVNRINEQLPKNADNVVLTEKNANDIMTAAQAIQRSGASQQRAAQVMDIMDRFKAGQAVNDADRQIVVDFIKDAQQYVKPKKSAPRPARPPKELSQPRVRDRVVSYLDEAEKAATERIRSRRGNLNSLPIDEYMDYAIIGASKLAKGAVRFADWSEQMVRDFGEEVRPHLQNIYERAQDVLTQNTKRINEQTFSQAEKIADSYLRKNEANLRPADIDLVRNMARNVSELSGDAKRQASQDLQAVLNGFERAGIGRKISSIQYIFMLLNPVTQVRNVLGNEMLYRMERFQRMLATPADIIVSKVSGKPREITFRSGPATWENFFKPSKDYWNGLIEGSKAGWRGVNPEGLTTSYDISGQAFRSKLNPLTYLEKTLGAVMKGFDYASYSRTVNQRLREMAHLDAINSGVTGRENVQAYIDRYMANLDDNIASIAQEYGKYVTLQDNTALSRSLQSFRGGLNKLTTGSRDFGGGSIILPFAKTPANLLMRALDYSPAGVFRAVSQAAQIMRSRDTDLTRADVIQSVTRALFGTGVGAVGLWLASKGVLRGDSSPDRDIRELEKQAGLSQYQINATALQRVLGALVTGDAKSIDQAAKPRQDDMFWQYEWAQPSSIPLALGANIIQERRQAARDALKKGTTESTAKQILDATLGAANTLMNTSVLSGIQQAFDFPPGEDNKVKAFAENVLKQIPSMFVPSMFSRINQLGDEALRETYSPDYWDKMLNPAQSRIPILAQQLPQRVDTLGQPQTRENSFYDVFLSPSQRSQFKPSREAQLVMDLLSETGDERLAPRAVPKYITGTLVGSKESKRVDLTTEQYVRYQTIVGQETARLLSKIPDHLSTEAKVKRVLDALDKAGEKGRKEMRKELGMKKGR